MMIYLHHYPASLFSEKIRLMLGYLDQTWNSVTIASIMPRPRLMPLSGGYRRTPVLQIGANVYCDTQIIAKALARHCDNSDLYAPGFAANRIADWADTHLFRTTVALNFRPEALGSMMSRMSETDMEAFVKDRAELSGDAPIVSLAPEAAMAILTQVLNDMNRSLESDFLFSDRPSIADFSMYHNIWFLKNNPVNAALTDGYQNVEAWYERMAAFGHGQIVESTGELALAAAAASEPALPELDFPSETTFAVGEEVTVAPTDYGCIPVPGRLVAMSSEEVVIERSSDETGALFVHFPQTGFLVSRA
ncbi:MAG: glutathione S-transferase [Candidatus Azotimanducaceae bacterium]|jgi:glutathione S-transferase